MERRASKLNPYECLECGYKTTRRGNLKAHCLKHHGFDPTVFRTARQMRDWERWMENEERKPLTERRIWWVEGTTMRLTRKGEYGAALGEARKVIRINKAVQKGQRI